MELLHSDSRESSGMCGLVSLTVNVGVCCVYVL
uniref:Uncharacterized protein n=1 Tax=Arundo donax TaxID=35708 RepID=A0A0A9A6X4_ARUDO